MANRFNRSEHLKSRKSIESLFASGKSVKFFPLMMLYRQNLETTEFGIKVAFTVSKRLFKRAVDRNRIKRLMRESYRLNKSALTLAENTAPNGLDIIFIYTGKALPEFAEIQDKIIRCLQRLPLFIPTEPNDASKTNKQV